MTVSLAPASALDDDALARLFTAVYRGYWHPIEIDAAALRRMVATYDLELDASRVALDADVPVGLAMLAVRGGEGWLGGMGVLPERRGAGLGTALTRALVASAREHGVRRLRLEVLEQNAPAQAIYREVGFRRLRDVAIWRLDAPPSAAAAAEVDVDTALDALSATEADAPWQRSPATVERMRAAGAELHAAATPAGHAVFAAAGGGASLLLLDAPDDAGCHALLAAPFAHGAASLLWLNGPTDGVAAAALRSAGATVLGLQHELALLP